MVRIRVVEEDAEIGRKTRIIIAGRKMEALEGAAVTGTIMLITNTSMKRKRSLAGPRKSTSLAMKVKNPPVEVVEEVGVANAHRDASMTVKMATRMFRVKTINIKMEATTRESSTEETKTIEATSVNTTRVAST